jgi:hypothetical protein
MNSVSSLSGKGEKRRRVLAATGKDLRDFLAKFTSDVSIESLLALDDDAAVQAHHLSIPYCFIEDFFEPGELKTIIMKALDFSRTWFEPHINDYTKNFVVWPQIDQNCLRWFWRESFAAKAVLDILCAQEEEIIALYCRPQLPVQYYYASDVFGRTLHAMQYKRGRGIPVNRGVWRAPGTASHPLPQSLAKLKGVMVCVLNPAEIQRSREMIRALSERYTGTVLIVALGHFSEPSYMGIPVLQLGPPPVPPGDETFSSAWKTLQANPLPLPRGLAKSAMQCLEWYHFYRWPMLQIWLETLRDFFETTQPACVFGTDLDDAESQLPFVAARQAGIPSLAWGHALVTDFRAWLPYFADKVMVATEFGIRSAEAAGVPSVRAIPVSGMDREDIYPTCETSWPARKYDNELRVLVLPMPVFIGDTSIILGSVRAAARFIQNLAAPPNDLAPYLHIRIKEHPTFKDFSPFLLANIDYESITFPSQSSLIPLLDESDICISLGYYGCGLIHASKRVPTILLIEDTLINVEKGSQQAVSNYPLACNNFNEVWSIIRKILNDKKFCEYIIEKQKIEFADTPKNAVNWLDLSDLERYKSISKMHLG